jgi:hypothetical protein
MSSFVQEIGSISASSVTFGSPPTAGHLVAIFWKGNASGQTVSGVADGSGWTITSQSNGGAYSYAAYCKASGASSTATISTTVAGILMGEWVPPTSFAKDLVNPYFGSSTGAGSITFTPAGSGELAILYVSEAPGNGWISSLSGTGVVQRGSTATYAAIGDSLSTAGGSNLVDIGSTGCVCCGGGYYAWVLAFETPAAAPSSAIFDSMNE